MNPDDASPGEAEAPEHLEPPAGPADVPTPPWLARRASRPVRTPLTRDAIIDAALEVLDSEGSEQLSMRRVAAQLGVGAASLYWHVPSKAVLIDLVLDRVIGEVELPPPEPERWREQLREHAHQMRAILGRHGDLARLTMGRVPIGPSLMLVVEWQLALLRAAGIPDHVAALTGDLLALYVGAFAVEDVLFVSSLSRQDDESEDFHGPEQFFAMVHEYFMNLPPARFPHTTALVDQIMGADRDQRFAFGLDVLLAGIAAQAAASPSPSEA